MFRLAYSVVHRALAEDVTQDTMLKAWLALPTFRGDSSMRGWIMRIAHNTAISTIRSRRAFVTDPTDLPEDTDAPQQLPEDRVELSQVMDDIDTTVINLGVAAIFFGLSASFTLLVGLGGREVAGEVAATRILRRTLRVGDRIETGELAGRIVGVHPTAIELETETGQRVLVPSSTIAGEQLVIDRAAQD